MKYKTTYFVLGMNKGILNSMKMIRECIIKDELVAEAEKLEVSVKADVNEFIESITVDKLTTIKGEFNKDFFGVKTPKYITSKRKLTKREREKLLKLYQVNDILLWKDRVRILPSLGFLDMSSLCLNERVKKLQELRKRLNEIEKVTNRYTREDEVRLNSHLIEVAAEGWRLHSMNPIIKGLHDMELDYHAGYGFGHDIQEGFVMVWEKD